MITKPILSLSLLLMFGCHSHVLLQKDAMSRDYSYISFANTHAPYIRHGEVGGEHMSITKLIAFAGDRYRLDVTPPAESLQLYVTGEGFTVVDRDSEYSKELRIEADEAIVEIAMTAHPDSVTYTLKLSRL